MKVLQDGRQFSLTQADSINPRLPVGTYDINANPQKGFYLASRPNFVMPEKIYGGHDKFATRVLKTFNALNKGMAALLSGPKGCGKTLTAKKIAIDSQLPLLSGRIIGDAGFDYYRLMARADVMVGNSSSGFTEAASFGLPVVNIGTRQRGRVPQPNIINVNWDAGEIRDAIVYATAPGYRDKFKDERNIYGTGHAAERIVRIAKEYLRRKK